MKTKDIFYAPEIAYNHILPPDESNHCVKVLRKKEGDEIMITDGCGSFFLSQIILANHKACEVKILELITKGKTWNFQLSIAFAPTKNLDRIEWFVEKATEIGIDEFIPILCENSERKQLKIERLHRIVISACKQSQKASFPRVEECTSFNDFINRPFHGDKYIAHCYDSERTVLPHIYEKGKSALILIGPEGDFTQGEVRMAETKGFRSISLTDSRLRTETAALFACNTIQILNI